jgi:hypothetical protein
MSVVEMGFLIDFQWGCAWWDGVWRREEVIWFTAECRFFIAMNLSLRPSISNPA